MSPRQQQAITYFVAQGWTPEQAAGIVANLTAESGLDAAAAGDGGSAYGIAQWHPDRQQQFAAVMGEPIKGSSLESQLAFVQWELGNTEKRAGDLLHECASAPDAGSCISMRYERPADKLGEAERRGKLAQELFAAYAPAPQPTSQPETQPMPILALISAFGPILAQLIPQIANAVSGERAKQNLTLAGTIFDTVTKAAGASNIQDAVEKMQNAGVLKSVTDAVTTHPDIQPALQLIDMSGVPAARSANSATTQPDRWFGPIISPVFIMSLALVAMLVMILGNVLGMPWGGSFQNWSENTRSNVVFAVITGAIGAITGYWFGTTVASNKKDQIIAAQAAPPDGPN